MVKRVLLSRQLSDELCRLICSGRYRPGDRLPAIQEMATESNVSVTTMREAIRSLELAGILEVQHGRGVFVSEHVSLNDDSVSTMLAINSLKLKTVYEARLVVELGAVALAVERATEDDVERMRRAVNSVSNASTPEDLSRADIDLHMTLINATHNPLLLEMLQPLVRAIANDIRFLHSLPQEYEEFHLWHQRILDAFARRDVEACRESLRGHLVRGLEILTAAGAT